MKRTVPLRVRIYCGLFSFVLLATAVNAQDPPKESQLRMAREAWKLAADEGWIEGIRCGDVIRPDLLSVTIDGGVVGALDPGNKAGVAALGDPADFQRPQSFTISSPTDPNYRQPVHPNDVGRVGYEGRNCMNAKTMWPLYVHTIHWHDFFLYLPSPMQSGHTYIVEVRTDTNRDDRFKYEWRLDYNEKKTTTKAIKINQVAYSAMAKRRYAYVGWWAGDRGKVTFPELDRFEVVDEETGQAVHRGEVTLRQSGDVNSGEDVYQMDIAALKPGRYHIYIPGFPCSETFQVGGAGIHELYYHTMRAFFHQRCGQELKEPWTWVQKPACHTELWESGNFVAGPGAIHHGPGNRDEHAHYEPKPGEKKTSYRGGYHDAADFDTFTYHLPATAQILTAYELYPKAFGDGDLDLPESGNGMPDVLDEAEWGLSFYIDHQYSSGAIPLGRVNHCDARKQNIQGDKDAPMPPFGLLPPMRLSTPTFAAVSAQFSRLIREHDPAKADRYLAAAQKAFDYAKDRDPEDIWREFTSNRSRCRSTRNANKTGYRI